MWPILLKIGPLPINTFGVMIVIAFLVGSWRITKDAMRLGIDPEKIQQICWMVLGAIVLGGRLMFIIVNPKIYLPEPWRIFYIWEGGLVFYGGFLGTIATVAYYARKYKLSIPKITDIFAVGGMLGQAIGRIGCIVAGDDHGRVVPGTFTVDSITGQIQAVSADQAPWWSLMFHKTVSFVGIDTSGIHLYTPQNPPVGQPLPSPAMDLRMTEFWLYPTQIMMSMKDLFLFLFLAWFAKRKKFDGQVTAMLLMGYSVLRFVVETYRGDIGRGVYLQPESAVRDYFMAKTTSIGFYLTTSQVISMGLFVAGAIMYVSLRNKGIAPIPDAAKK